MTYHILLTFDVEDWFQVENFKECVPFSSWPSCELRVEKSTHKILDLLDSIEVQRSEVGGQRSESNPQNASIESGKASEADEGVSGPKRTGVSPFHPCGAETPTGRRQEAENTTRVSAPQG